VAALAVTGSLRLHEGGGPWLLNHRNPFYRQTFSLLNPPTIKISHPVDGVTYYHNLLDLNSTVTGGSPPYLCWYRINSGSWTSYDCVSTPVSFPSGEVNLYVAAQDTDGYLGFDEISFIVRAREEGGKIFPELFLAGGLGAGICITIIYKHENDDEEDN